MRYCIPLLLISLMYFACMEKGHQKVEPIENSDSILWATYEAEENKKNKKILLVSGDEEYRSEEALPQLAKILSTRHGFDCMVLFAQNPEKLGLVDPNYRYNIPGLHLLNDADLVVWFTRFRELPVQQMKYLENYLLEGKPLIAIRTATHAFNIEDEDHPFAHYSWNYEGSKKDWKLGLGKKILGETWYIHHGDHKQQSTRGVIPENAIEHPILNGIANGSIWGPTDVYGIRMPLLPETRVFVQGQTIERTGTFDANDLLYGMRESDTVLARSSGTTDSLYDPNELLQPIVWLNPYRLENGKKGAALTSTIGAATDMLDEEVRRVYVNASFYLLRIDVPEKANVNFVGEYRPSQYGFHTDEYWVKKNLRVADFIED